MAWMRALFWRWAAAWSCSSNRLNRELYLVSRGLRDFCVRRASRAQLVLQVVRENAARFVFVLFKLLRVSFASL